ncbi:MAG: tRNA adenosine(34) deaminase TadA [Desulfomicrobium sp.]|nr:tRNA adenosine(34) deaminase TadA [Desulfomicrobium sp.]
MSFYDNNLATPDMDVLMAWEPLMHEALLSAQRAEDQGDVPVGAVVVNDCGRILGRGENRTVFNNDPTAHAEILAIREACRGVGNYRLSGAVLVVTLEPCMMCLGAIIQARLAGVVFAAADPKAGCLSSQIKGNELSWSNHRFWVLQGVLEKTCSSMLSSFFQRRRCEQKSLKKLVER